MTMSKNTRSKSAITRGVFRTLSNIQDEAFCKNSYWLKPLTISARRSIFDVCFGSEFASDNDTETTVKDIPLTFYC